MNLEKYKYMVNVMIAEQRGQGIRYGLSLLNWIFLTLKITCLTECRANVFGIAIPTFMYQNLL